MSDENGQAEETSEAKSAKSGGLDFGAVFAKLKDVGSFLSLDGKASRGEYWAFFLTLWLPLTLFSGGLLYDALILKDGAMVQGASLLASAFLTIANLVMFPVTVRRLRDANICVSLAAIMTPAVVFFAVAAVFYPWLVCGSALIILAAGILPSRTGADGAQAAGVDAKAKMCFLAALLFVFAATISGSMMDRFILSYKLKMVGEKLEKEADKFKDKFKVLGEELKEEPKNQEEGAKLEKKKPDAVDDSRGWRRNRW